MLIRQLRLEIDRPWRRLRNLSRQPRAIFCPAAGRLSEQKVAGEVKELEEFAEREERMTELEAGLRYCPVRFEKSDFFSKPG